MKKILIIAALVAAFTLALGGIALGQQTSPTAPTGNKNAGARIEQVKQRLAKAIERAGKVKDKALKQAKAGEERLDKAISTLKGQGKDVSKLLQYKEVLASGLKTAESDYNALISKLKEAEGLASAATAVQLKAALQEAKQLRGRVKADAKEIKKYARTVVRPAIKKLMGKSKSPGKQKTQTAPVNPVF
jgi:DNA repair exonuclease SbcCD ATPase subunit